MIGGTIEEKIEGMIGGMIEEIETMKGIMKEEIQKGFQESTKEMSKEEGMKEGIEILREKDIENQRGIMKEGKESQSGKSQGINQEKDLLLDNPLHRFNKNQEKYKQIHHLNSVQVQETNNESKLKIFS